MPFRPPGSWTRHRVITLIVVVAVIALATGGWAYAHSSSTTTTATTTTTLVPATTSTLSQTVITTGTIEPAVEALLSFPVSGTVTAVSATVGQPVAQGAVLATVDPTDLQSAVNVASTTVAAAQQQVITAATGTAAAQSSATALLTAAQSKLATAQQTLAGATLSSPIAGTVASVSLTVGTQVRTGTSSTTAGATTVAPKAGAATGTGATTTGAATSSAQIVVISTASWIVNATVSGSDLAQIKPGLQVEVTPTGASAPVFGTVSTVGIVASTTSGNTATFPVTIALTGTPTGLYAGGSAAVTVYVKLIQNALTVPTGAVQTDHGQTVVQKSVDGQVATQPVTTGLVSGPLTQITAGLSDGDQVVLTGRAGGGFGGTGGTGGTGGGRGGGGTGGAGNGGARTGGGA